MKKLRLADLPEIYGSENPLEAARRICEVFPSAREIKNTRELATFKKSLTDLLKEAKFSPEVRDIVHCSYTLPAGSQLSTSLDNEFYLKIVATSNSSGNKRYKEAIRRLGLVEETGNNWLRARKEFVELLQLMDSKGYRNFRN